MKIEKLKINLIDIGSVGGIEEPWQKKYIKNLIQFEPNESALVKENYWKYPYAISDQNKMETFYVYGESGTGSSLKKQNIKWFEKNHNLVSDFGERRLNESWLERSKLIKSFDVECIKLDNFLNNHRKKNKFCTFEFMKSDTQGGEWEILQGAENFIKNECLGLELELFKYPLYENIKLESEIKEFLFDYGFRVAGWTGYKNSFLSQADYLFLKTRNLSREDKIKIDFIEKIYSPNGSDRLIKSHSLINKLKKRIKKLVI